jgi:hypothetical protein
MPSIFRLLPVLVLAGLMAGCETEPPKSSKMLRKTIGETTQNVLKLDEALASGGQLAATSITATDPLTVTSDAYKTTVPKIAQMRVTNDINMFEALNERKPEGYDEFMSAIIKKGQPDGIQLPMLPFYQEYAFDEKNCALVVVEFPAKKAEYEKERDKELGR